MTFDQEDLYVDSSNGLVWFVHQCSVIIHCCGGASHDPAYSEPLSLGVIRCTGSASYRSLTFTWVIKQRGECSAAQQKFEMIASDPVNDVSHGGHGAGEPSQQVLQAARARTQMHTHPGTQKRKWSSSSASASKCIVLLSSFKTAFCSFTTAENYGRCGCFLMEEICLCSPLCTVGNKGTPASEKLAGVWNLHLPCSSDSVRVCLFM